MSDLNFLPSLGVSLAGVAADVSRRRLRGRRIAPTDVGDYCLSRTIRALAVLCLLGLPFGGQGQPAIKIESGVAQLFVDDGMIEQHRDLRRTLHQPVKDNDGNRPVIAARSGTTLLAYGSIVRDTRLQRWVMFVQEFPSRQMYRLTSADGLDWQPNTHEQLERVTLDLSFAPLPPEARGQPGIDLFSCYYDAADADRPYKGWVWAANVGNEWEGIWYVDSADGLRWRKGGQIFSGYAGEGDPSCRAITQDGRTLYGPGDVTLFAPDPVGKRFLGLFKFYSPRDIAPGHGSRARAYAFLERLDRPFDIEKLERIQLMPAMAARNGDAPADEYYASTAWRYESLWLGGLKIFHARDNYPWSAAGCAFLKLVVSRDGLDWRKVPFTNDTGVAEVFIPNGVEGGQAGRNDGGYISEFSQGPLRVGDELIYYYSASSYGKNASRDRRIMGGGIFRARLRRDGFVSVDAGTLTTPLLQFQGLDLLINAVGPVAVQVLDESGKTRASANLAGNSLRHLVRFEGKSLREAARRGRCRLRFEVTPPGQLYSFTVADRSTR